MVVETDDVSVFVIVVAGGYLSESCAHLQLWVVVFYITPLTGAQLSNVSGQAIRWLDQGAA